MKLSRRGFIAGVAATGAARGVPQVLTKTGGKRVLTLVYDKTLGMMRAVERVVR